MTSWKNVLSKATTTPFIIHIKQRVCFLLHQKLIHRKFICLLNSYSKRLQACRVRARNHRALLKHATFWASTSRKMEDLLQNLQLIKVQVWFFFFFFIAFTWGFELFLVELAWRFRDEIWANFVFLWFLFQVMNRIQGSKQQQWTCCQTWKILLRFQNKM